MLKSNIFLFLCFVIISTTVEVNAQSGNGGFYCYQGSVQAETYQTPTTYGCYTPKGRIGEATPVNLAQVYELIKLNQNITEMKKQIEENTKSIQNTNEKIEKQNKMQNEAFHTLIVKRFEMIPSEVINNQVFNDALKKLKEQILEDLKQMNTPGKSPETQNR